MKIKNHITAVLLLMCILLTPALASSASAHAYDHVYNDVTVITPDSLEDVFGETEVERAAYTYEMVELSNSRAVVALEMELKIGHDYYTTIVSGTVNAYSLPSGDTLYEGPINGSMTVGEEEYRVTVGFTKVKSTDDVMISTTIQSDTQMVFLHCGGSIMQGEVLEFFMRSMENENASSNSSFLESESVNEIGASDFGNNTDHEVSPLYVDLPPIIEPVPHPGGGTSYPPYGEAIHQTHRVALHDNNYTALHSDVYWDENSNLLIVTITPYSADSLNYYNTTDYASFRSVNLRLYSIGASIDVAGDMNNQLNTTIQTKCRISDPLLPDASDYLIDNEYEGYGLLSAILTYIISQASEIPGPIVSYALNNLFGKIVSAPENDAHFKKHAIEIAPFGTANPSDLDGTNVMAFGYFLEKQSQSQYIGDTEYVAKGYITYKLTSYVFIPTLGISPTYHYMNFETTHTGVIDLQ